MWGVDCDAWREALAHHYSNNPHHPQFCPGQPMEQTFLEESVVDMLACQWERVCHGREEATAREIATMDQVYLERYEETDRRKVRQILDQILLADSETENLQMAL